MLWGFTPPLDLVGEYNRFACANDKSELNVLLVGNTDLRHVLKTTAKYYERERKVRVNFYVYDALMEIVARHLLLLTIALEPSDQLGLREKVWIWMELYGNTLLRPNSATYFVKKSNQLIRLVTNNKYLERRMPAVDLSHIRYKERDLLENIFKFWVKEKFYISKFWDARLRQTLGTRYDSRMGVYDWDYHMKMVEAKGVRLISNREYNNWRETGVAFTWPEFEYSIPNLTFAVGITNVGNGFNHMGYRGEMTYGPFLTFGTTCEDDTVFAKVNDVYKKRATDITQRNLLQLFHEIERQESYNHSIHKDDFNYGLCITEQNKVNIDNSADVPRIIDKSEETYSPIHIPHRVFFLSSVHFETIAKKQEFKHFFDLINISYCLLPRCKEIDNFIDIAKDGSILIFETEQCFFGLEKEKRKDFGKEISDFAEKNFCEKLFDFDPCYDDYAYYQVKEELKYSKTLFEDETKVSEEEKYKITITSEETDIDHTKISENNYDSSGRLSENQKTENREGIIEEQGKLKDVAETNNSVYTVGKSVDFENDLLKLKSLELTEKSIDNIAISLSAESDSSNM